MSNDSKTVGDLNLEDEHITVGVSDTLQEATQKAPDRSGWNTDSFRRRFKGKRSNGIQTVFDCHR